MTQSEMLFQDTRILFSNKGVLNSYDKGFKDFDMLRIYARPFEKNLAARKTLENAGFELEGIFKKSIFKNGEILDSCMYAKTV